jgi:hypothetical protein
MIGGSEAKEVLITGKGPSLAEFGVPNTLADPTIRLFDADRNEIAFNDNWMEASNSSDISASAGAPTNALESAILMTLQPGTYTVHMAGSGNTTGQGIVEVWERMDATSTRDAETDGNIAHTQASIVRQNERGIFEVR